MQTAYLTVRPSIQGPHAQRGAVMIVALVFLLLIAMLGISSSNINVQQLMMAGNEQSRIEATQRAETVIDAILDNSGNTPLTGDVGYTLCAIGDTDVDCDSSTVTLDSSVSAVLTGGSVSYHVTRMGPLVSAVPPLNEELASSSSAYQVATMELDATYDGSASAQGVSTVVQGVMFLVPSGQQ